MPKKLNVGYGNAQAHTGKRPVNPGKASVVKKNTRTKPKGGIAKDSLVGTYGKTGPLSRGPK